MSKKRAKKSGSISIPEPRRFALRSVFLRHEGRIEGFKDEAAARALHPGEWAVFIEESIFETVRMMELLAAASHGEREASMRNVAEQLAEDIRDVWQMLGIKNGVVRVLE